MIYIANTTIAPCDGVFGVTTISLIEARKMLSQEFISAIGHQSTAEIISELLGIEISMNRMTISEMSAGDFILAFKLNSRPPEGVILNREQIEEIGYTWKLMHYMHSDIHHVTRAI